MLGSEWLYGVIALLVGVHVLTLLYAYRRQGEPTAGHTQADTERSMPGTSDDDGDELVSCGHCGAHNENGYQYCRECAADLTTGSSHRYMQRELDDAR